MRDFRFILLGSLFFLLALTSCPSLFAQTGQVTGSVRDAKTLKPLPFAHVFINHTTLGTVVDSLGTFTLKHIPTGVNELVFSFIGYLPYSTKSMVKEGETVRLDVLLQPDDLMLNAVEVGGERDKEWESQFRHFETVFWGNTPFAKSCKILNPWVLEFKEARLNGKRLFSASASAPLEIENLALGYKITYYLKNMIASPEAYHIIGNVLYDEILTTDPVLAKTWEKNRRVAYYGSSRHLFKSIVDRRVKEEGFNLYINIGKGGFTSYPNKPTTFTEMLNHTKKNFLTEKIVLPGKIKGEYTILVNAKVEVHFTLLHSTSKVYKDISYPVSWIVVQGGVLEVTSNGVVLNPSSLTVSGEMYEARVANMLPHDYQPGAATKSLLASESFTQGKMRSLQEKPYLHTDKPYYYPGEKIWFKAYMNYQSPSLMDSLSRVLYVELIGPDKKILHTKILKIENGTAYNNFDVPNTLGTGNYFLRAYTNWMLNYSPNIIFVKPVPILELHDWPVPSSPESTATLAQGFSQITMKADRASYKPREKITLSFTLSDTLSADLSVAVTDAAQVVAFPEEKEITQCFPFPLDEKDAPSSPVYPIETGISLGGQYKNKKQKPEKAHLLVVQGKFKDMGLVETDDHGNFWLSGFQFYDSAEIGFQYVDKKKTNLGKIQIHVHQAPMVGMSGDSLPLKTIKKESLQRNALYDNSPKDALLLKEVRVETKKIDVPNENLPKIYGQPDFSVSGETLTKSSSTSLVDALKGRIPGFNVVLFKSGEDKETGDGGTYTYVIRLGGPSNFAGAGSTEPLLIIDGMPMASGGPMTAYGMLMQINPETVERVDVIKYGGAAIFGTRGGNGVIAVYTKGGKYFNATSDSTRYRQGFFQSVKAAGYCAPPAFTSPDYGKSEVESSLPDYRTTVYWNPQVKTEKGTGTASISFYAADFKTRYRVVVEGVTSTGQPIRGVYVVDVSD